MGNSNKHKKVKKSQNNLNNSAILSSHKNNIGLLDYSNEDLMKSEILNDHFMNSQTLNEDLIDSQDLNEGYNFFEDLILNEEQSNLSLSEDNFLGEYKDDFKVIKLIQKDLISRIYMAENLKDNKTVSLKVYNKKNLEQGDYDFFLEQIKREEEIIKLCKSDNIINIYQKIETSDNIIYEMESWDTNLSDSIKKNGPLSNNLKKFKEILFGIINALEVLNKNGVMHRDIRPSNLFLIGKTTVKLGGFEHAIFIKNNISESVGFYFYAAPEIIKNLEYDEKCDL